jgi:hypothetical protein
MNKQTKMILGVVLLGGVGYYLWSKNQAPKAFANLSSPSMMGGRNFANAAADRKDECKCHIEEMDGIYLCGDGKSLSKKSGGACKGSNKNLRMARDFS